MICYDPRDPAQAPDDPSTWKDTDNPALTMAEISRNMGKLPPWEKIKELADWFNSGD